MVETKLELPRDTNEKNPIKIKICRATLDIADGGEITTTQLRGFIGNLFVDDVEFHHHSEKSYHYPLVQYKKIDGKLTVMGLQRYADVLMNKIVQLERVVTPRNEVKVNAVHVEVDDFEIDSQQHVYRFITPWLPLNEENYQKFKEADENNRQLLLERILIGNTLSMLKGLGIFLDYRITASISQFRPVAVSVHGNKFEAFWASYSLKLGLPDFVGLGKSVSKGFGAIRRVS